MDSSPVDLDHVARSRYCSLSSSRHGPSPMSTSKDPNSAQKIDSKLIKTHRSFARRGRLSGISSLDIFQGTIGGGFGKSRVVAENLTTQSSFVEFDVNLIARPASETIESYENF